MKNPLLNLLAFILFSVLMVSCSETDHIINNDLEENFELQIQSNDDDNDLVYYEESGKSNVKFKMQITKVQDDTDDAYRVDAYGRFLNQFGDVVLIHMTLFLDEAGEVRRAKVLVTNGEEVTQYVLQDDDGKVTNILKEFVIVQINGNSLSTSPNKLKVVLDAPGMSTTISGFQEAGIQEYWGLVESL